MNVNSLPGNREAHYCQEDSFKVCVGEDLCVTELLFVAEGTRCRVTRNNQVQVHVHLIAYSVRKVVAVNNTPATDNTGN